MRRHARWICLALFALWGTATSAQTRNDFLLFTDPSRRFSVEFPKTWKWMLISGSGEPIATFVDPRSEAAVIVERFRLKQRLAPEDVADVFAEIEVDYIKENQSGATEIEGHIERRSGMPLAVIDYRRSGVNAQERVRQYSFPIEDNLYRVTCMAVAPRFASYEAVFAAIVSTLKSARDLAAAP